MKLFLDADVINIAEEHAKPYAPARIGALDTNDCADFREAVRGAAAGQCVHVPWAMAQQRTFECMGELPDGARIFQDHGAPAFDADEWAAIVD